ncbi:MAG TPA: hypothetical protein VI230_06805, partial [Ignavibacteriaceae bacterium]
MANETTYKLDIEELLFARKNKEYGAYRLRKSYKKYLTIAMWTAIVLIVLSATAPGIYRWINPENETVVKPKK